MLKVTVFGVPELTRDVTVDTDGTFDFPLIGRIKAAGQPVRASRPSSRPAVERLSGQPHGERRRGRVPIADGLYPWRGSRSRPQDAGGQCVHHERARGSGVHDRCGLVRHRLASTGGRGHVEGPVLPADNTAGQLRVSRKDLEMGRAMNIRLQDGDTIFVPKAETFFITGFVRSPGSYPIDGDLNVLQALALAGGATDQAAQNRITIDRVVDGQLTHVKIKGLTDRSRPATRSSCRDGSSDACVHVVAGNLFGGVERLLVEIASGPTVLAARVCALLRRPSPRGARRDAARRVTAGRGSLQPADRRCGVPAVDSLVSTRDVDLRRRRVPFALGVTRLRRRPARRCGASSGRTTRSTDALDRTSRPPDAADLVICNSEYTSQRRLRLDRMRRRAPLSMRRSRRIERARHPRRVRRALGVRRHDRLS